MLKNIKTKIIILISIILIIVGIFYQNSKGKQGLIELNNNIIEEKIEISDSKVLKKEEAENSDFKNEQEEIEYIKIHIAGQIKYPGLIELEKGKRIYDAIEKAGGVTENACLNQVNLAYILEDAQKIYIPSKEESEKEYIIVENSFQNSNESKELSIDINKASKEDFEKIPGIGPAMAEKIVNYRKENGKFKVIEDLKNVSGIGDKKFESIQRYICIK